MTVKRTMFLVAMLGSSVPLFLALGEKVNSAFFFLAILCSFGGFGLMFYALHREKTTKEKSQKVSPLGAILIFSAVGLWIAFIVFHNLR